jgi:glycosidase
MKTLIQRFTIVFVLLSLLVPSPIFAAPLPDTSREQIIRGSASNRASMATDICYQMFTDRFYDGDTANNGINHSADQSAWKLYWGGDFKGIQDKLDYLKNLGVTAIWLSPPVDNANLPINYNDGYGSNIGYHGYWARDFMKPEEHFGSWTDFDNLVSTAHDSAYDMKVIIDWAPNHSNPANPGVPNYGEQGSYYNNGTFVAAYDNDPNYYFHHSGGIEPNWDDRFASQYRNLFDLPDYSQEHPAVNAYMRSAIQAWMDHGIDGMRFDAVKHMPFGWQRAYADYVLNYRDMFLFGEWMLAHDQLNNSYQNTEETLYRDAVHFSDDSGINNLDFALYYAMQEVFASGNSMQGLDAVINKTAADFRYENNLVTFLDVHDKPRFLTVNNNNTLYHLALTFQLTVRGVPCIYYGTEQYLHNDTSGGGDPYNRPMMNSWDETTTAFKTIQALATLRKSQPALQFGSHQQRWINNDVYIYERKFGSDVVLVALNKSASSTYNITGLYTALPAGTYTDQLNGLLGGSPITVTAGSGGNNPVTAFNLGPGKAMVWSYKQGTEPSQPVIGTVMPTLTRAGNKVTLEGRGFGTYNSAISRVHFVNAGGTQYAATVVSWSANNIVVTVPATLPSGWTSVRVTNASSAVSTLYPNIQVLTTQQVPVTFRVNNAYTSPGEEVYLTGSVFELSNWSTGTVAGTNKPVTGGALGPALTYSGQYPTWFLTVSVPCGTTLQYKYLKILSNGTVKWENGSDHSYTTPACGSTPTPGEVTVNLQGWQP